jgi:ATP-dependent RNA helicase RhlB
MKFKELNLNEDVMRGIEDAGFTELTAVQEESLPLALAGKDVAAQAQTGTGKTAAFLLAIFNRIKAYDDPPPNRAPRAIAIAPTRELAVQILNDAEQLGKHTGLKMTAVYGGVDYQKQKDTVAAGVDLLVGTPGRLIDYFKQKVFSLKYIEILVIDEADRMFDMGFIADIRYMLHRMPEYNKRQSMLFSATLSHRVMELAYEHMNNPEKVSITPEQMTVDRIEQSLFHVGKDEKFSLLLGLLNKENPERTMLFMNTKRGAEVVVERLRANGYESRALFGDVPQNKRLKIIEEFKSGTLPILVATDVASRGLHIDNVTHVFNYDLPQDAEDYVHRIGRTARAGATGKAFSFADEEYVFSLEGIEDYIKISIPVSWPDEDMFVKPKSLSKEQRDKLADSKRARMAARGKGGPGGRSGGPGRPGGPGRKPGGGRGRPGGPRPDRPKPQAASPQAAKPATGEPSDKPKRRRRRKPKPQGGPEGGGGGNTGGGREPGS